MSLAVVALLCAAPPPGPAPGPGPAKAQVECRAPHDAAAARKAEVPRGRWTPEAHRRLAELVRSLGAAGGSYDPCARPLAVVDADLALANPNMGLGALAFDLALERAFVLRDDALTVLPQATRGELWPEGSPMTVEARAALRESYRAKCAEAPGHDADCSEWIHRLFAGRKPPELVSFAGEVSERAVLLPETAELIRTLDLSGWDVFVVSSAPDWLARVFVRRLDLREDRGLGHRSGTAAPVGPGRVIAVRTRVGPGGRRPALALGRTPSDRPFLRESTGEAVLVGAQDPELLSYAKALDWIRQPAFE